MSSVFLVFEEMHYEYKEVIFAAATKERAEELLLKKYPSAKFNASENIYNLTSSTDLMIEEIEVIS